MSKQKNKSSNTIFSNVFTKFLGLSTPSWFLKKLTLGSLWEWGGGVVLFFDMPIHFQSFFKNFLDISTRPRKNMTPWHPLVWHCPIVFSILGGDELAKQYTLSVKKKCMSNVLMEGRSPESSVANRTELSNCLWGLLVSLVLSHLNSITRKVTSHTSPPFLYAITIYPHHRTPPEHLCIFLC